MTTRATRSPRRRTVVALAVVLAVFAAFVVRLVDIQVVNASAHVAEAQSPQRLGVVRTLAGSRGEIVDETGTALASTVLVYDAQLDPALIVELEGNERRPPKVPWAEASEQMAEIIGMDGAEIRDRVERKLAEDPSAQYLPLATGLSTDQYLRLRDLGLSYLSMPSKSTRVYPNGAVAGNILGFVGTDGQALGGIEMMEDTCLAPTDGQQTYLRGASGNAIPGSEQVTDPADGGLLQLTINADLNWYLQQMIAEETISYGALSGSVFVVEVATGKIRAAAEYPVVDPNDPTAVPVKDRASRIFTDEFEPGSTFKAVTAAAIMEKGGVTPLSTVSTPDRMTFPNGAFVNDYLRHSVINYTLAGALIDSSNVALSQFGDKVPMQVRHDYLEAFGLGEKTAVDFIGERTGVLHPVEKWDAQSRYTTTFGHYYTVTVPQLASVYQIIANDGVHVPLSLVESCTASDGTVIAHETGESHRVIEESTAVDLQLMLENVASQGSLAERVAVPGYRIALKTGTAQKPNVGGPGYKTEERFTSMVGFAPAEDPEYVIAVTLDEPTKVRSSSATASAFQKAVTQVMKTYRVRPSTTPTDTSFPLTR